MRLLTKGNYQTPPHIQLFERMALDLFKDNSRRNILIQCPIRHGKSQYWSLALPLWHRLTHPERDVILSGHGSSFASEWGGAVRDLYEKCAPELFGLALGRHHQSEHWSTSDGGSMRTCGTGGSISGRGCHLLISDDQIKSQQDAESPVVRQSTWKFFVSDLYSRLDPDGKCVVILSRRHPEDMVGKIISTMEAGGDTWDIVRLPAIAEDGDPLGRTPGEALWPQRYDVEALRGIERNYELAGEGYLFSCLYQQAPLGDPASMEWPPAYFENILYDHLPLHPDDVFCHIVALDPSMGKNSKTGDYSALLHIVAARNHHLYVEDSTILRMTTTQCEDSAVFYLQQYEPAVAVIECNGFQEILADNIQLKCPGAPISKFISKVDKEVRLRSILTPYLSSKRLHIRNTPHNQLLLAQMKSFPTGQHDDGPDALCLGAIAFADLVRQVRQPPPMPHRLRV